MSKLYAPFLTQSLSGASIPLGRIVGRIMDEIGIKIERNYQGDGEWEHIFFSVSIGDCHDDTSLDCGEGNFKEIGKTLMVFPKKRPDEYSCTLESEYGSGDYRPHSTLLYGH